MQEIQQIGTVQWSVEEIKKSIPEFIELYQDRPIKNNVGGMKSPHMFATWFMLKKINPPIVIESGVWKGQGTWLIENAVPDATIFSIDIDLSFRIYKSKNVQYLNKDFSLTDWSNVKNKEEAVLFFDDHQNALERIKQGKMLGFKQFIFEDNYSGSKGDCYSLKKAFQHVGHSPKTDKITIKSIIKQVIANNKSTIIHPNSQDAEYLCKNLTIYYEFPPVFIKNKTRWGDSWDETYPTPTPLYSSWSTEALQLFYEEAIYYTWICYARLR